MMAIATIGMHSHNPRPHSRNRNASMYDSDAELASDNRVSGGMDVLYRCCGREYSISPFPGLEACFRLTSRFFRFRSPPLQNRSFFLRTWPAWETCNLSRVPSGLRVCASAHFHV